MNNIFNASEKIWSAADKYERNLINKELLINTLMYQIEILQAEKTYLLRKKK